MDVCIYAYKCVGTVTTIEPIKHSQSRPIAPTARRNFFQFSCI